MSSTLLARRNVFSASCHRFSAGDDLPCAATSRDAATACKSHSITCRWEVRASAEEVTAPTRLHPVFEVAHLLQRLVKVAHHGAPAAGLFGEGGGLQLELAGGGLDDALRVEHLRHPVVHRARELLRHLGEGCGGCAAGALWTGGVSRQRGGTVRRLLSPFSSLTAACRCACSASIPLNMVPCHAREEGCQAKGQRAEREARAGWLRLQGRWTG